jgi:hypothetical protein
MTLYFRIPFSKQADTHKLSSSFLCIEYGRFVHRLYLRDTSPNISNHSAGHPCAEAFDYDSSDTLQEHLIIRHEILRTNI